MVDEAISLSQARKDVIIAEATAAGAAQDFDEWLIVSQEDLENTLAAASTAKASSSRATLPESGLREVVDGEMDDPESRAAHQQAEKLSKLAKNVEHFVNAQGDLEGARFEE